MKRLVPLGLAALLAVAAISFPSSGNAQSAGVVSSLLNKMARSQKSLKSLRATISMEKYNAQLRDSDNYHGVVLYIPGAGRHAFVRVEWQKPRHEILTVANGQYVLYRPRLNTAYVGNSNSRSSKAGGGALDLLNMPRAQWQALFDQAQDVRFETLWGGVKTTHLKINPKGYKYAEVWIDEDGMAVQTKTVDQNDDATTVRLTNMEKNAPISMDEFNLKLDSSVKKVKG